MEPQFTTERLLLRHHRPEDREDIFEYASNPENSLYKTWKPHTSLEETDAYLAQTIRSIGEGNSHAYVIVKRGTAKVVGAIGLSINGCRGTAGYIIRKEEWGRGYMTEAFCAIIASAFRTIPELERIEAICDTANEGSARVMEKSGLTREGILRRYQACLNISPEPRDHYIYSIIR